MDEYYDFDYNRDPRRVEPISLTRLLVIIVYLGLFIDLLSLFNSSSREFHFNDFPNFYLFGITLLFFSTLWRGWDACGFFDSITGNLDWKKRKDDWEISDFQSEVNYTSRFKNRLYVVLTSVGFIFCYLSF
jgi:hypothetical protein